MNKNITTKKTENKLQKRNAELLAQVAKQATPLFQVKPLPTSIMSRSEQCCIR